MVKKTHLLIYAFILPLTFFLAVTASAQDKVVVIPLFETVIEPIEPYSPMPDTGQTTSYTTTFGEDHDYTINPPSYTDNGDGTVTDNVTDLLWQKTDDNTTRTWDNAWAYCQGLSPDGKTNWRLPSANELMSIVHYGLYDPAIDSFAFPETNSSYYWSATTYASGSGSARLVNFANGVVYFYKKSNTNYVRCVR